MNDKSKELNAFFNETYDRFGEITEYAILLEKMGGGKVQVNIINELRGVLYHLYRFLDAPDENIPNPAEKGHIDAIEHLTRAYYDTFSLISAFLIKGIREFSEKYSKEVIYKVYPEYFTKVVPEMNAISVRIAEIRAGRKTDKQQAVTNRDTINIMLYWHSELVSRTSLFIEFQEEERKTEEKSKKKDKLDLAIKLGWPILVLILATIINYYMRKAGK